MKDKIKQAIIDQIDYLHNGEGLETEEIIEYLKTHDFTLQEEHDHNEVLTIRCYEDKDKHIMTEISERGRKLDRVIGLEFQHYVGGVPSYKVERYVLRTEGGKKYVEEKSHHFNWKR